MKLDTLVSLIFLCMFYFMAITMGTAFYLNDIMPIEYYFLYCVAFTIYTPFRIREVLKK